MKSTRISLAAALVFFVLSGCSSIDQRIEKGQFDMAKRQIRKSISKDKISDLERIALEEKIDIMHRIELDFNRSREDVLEYIHKYYPDIKEEKLKDWEESNVLENMIINGKKRYFARSAANVFRINKEAKARKIEVDGKTKDGLVEFLEQNIPMVIEDVKSKKSNTGKPLKMKFTYTLTVDADAVLLVAFSQRRQCAPAGRKAFGDISRRLHPCSEFTGAPNGLYAKTRSFGNPNRV